jgi:DNA-binding MarR family transcriptional regulator
MRISVNLTLHQRILLAISKQPAESIAALARDLEAPRPSISRAVRSLLDEHLVAKNRRTLHLTELGEKEVEVIRYLLSTKAQETMRIATRIAEQANKSWKLVERFAGANVMNNIVPQTPHIQTLLDSMVEASIMKPLDDLTRALNTFDGGAFRQIQEAVDNSAIVQVVSNNNIGKIQEAVRATAYIQSINLNWLQATSSPLTHLLVENNAFMSGIIRDLEAMTQMYARFTLSSKALVDQVTSVTNAYDAYYSDFIHQFRPVPSLTQYSGIRIVVPTTTTSSLISSIRGIVESQVDLQEKNESVHIESTRGDTYLEQYYAMTPMLEQYLTPLGDRFIRKWHGAWQTLSSTSEDRYSQVLHSARELLMQVLAELAPDNVFTAEDLARHNNAKKPTRRMQAKYILDNSKTATDWVEKVAIAIDSTYDVLVSGAHSRDNKIPGDDSAASLLIVLGGLMIFLSSNHDKSSS